MVSPLGLYLVYILEKVAGNTTCDGRTGTVSKGRLRASDESARTDPHPEYDASTTLTPPSTGILLVRSSGFRNCYQTGRFYIIKGRRIQNTERRAELGLDRPKRREQTGIVRRS